MTMTLISTVTAGAGGLTDFGVSNIPQTYTDLLITISVRSSNSSAFVNGSMTIGAGTLIDSWRKLQGYAGSASSFNSVNGTGLDLGYFPGATSTSNTFSNTSIYIPNYSGSTNKSLSVDSVMENNVTGDYVLTLTAGLHASTAIVDAFVIGLSAGNFVQNSTISIYGITKGSGGATVS